MQAIEANETGKVWDFLISISSGLSYASKETVLQAVSHISESEWAEYSNTFLFEFLSHDCTSHLVRAVKLLDAQGLYTHLNAIYIGDEVADVETILVARDRLAALVENTH